MCTYIYINHFLRRKSRWLYCGTSLKWMKLGPGFLSFTGRFINSGVMSKKWSTKHVHVYVTVTLSLDNKQSFIILACIQHSLFWHAFTVFLVYILCLFIVHFVFTGNECESFHDCIDVTYIHIAYHWVSKFHYCTVQWCNLTDWGIQLGGLIVL